MFPRRLVLVAAALGFLCGAAWVAGIWSSSPVEFGLAGIEPSELWDQASSEGWLVTLGVTNREHRLVMISSEDITVQASINDRWTPVVAVPHMEIVGDGRSGYMLVAVPAGAEACRIEFGYQRELLRRRLLRALQKSAPRMIRLLPPSLLAWAQANGPQGGWGFPRPPHWTQVTTEVRLPPGAADFTKSHG